MGTRATIKVFEARPETQFSTASNKMLLAMYCQFDGYPSGVGNELYEFLSSREVVNGIGSNNNVFNGMGCLAAQLVSSLKGDRAGLYYVTGDEKDHQEYNYEIHGGYDENEGSCFSSIKPLEVIVKDYSNEIIFSGSLDEFGSWVSEEE